MVDALRLGHEEPTLEKLIVLEEPVISVLELVRSRLRRIALSRHLDQTRFQLCNASLSVSGKAFRGRQSSGLIDNPSHDVQ